MPATNTITAFFTFVAGTRARAAQVNTNFENFRGNIIPINTDTATASHQTHDLGSSDHQWRRIYLTEAPFVGGVQAGGFEVETWFDGSSPTDCLPTDSWLDRTSFPKLRDTGIAFQFVVPAGFTAGNRMSLALRGYCDTSPSHFTLEAGTALYRASLTSMEATAPANVFTTTSNINPTLSGAMFSDNTMHLMSADGVINGITVAAGDVLAVYLKRKGTAVADTNTGYFHLTNIQVDLST